MQSITAITAHDDATLAVVEAEIHDWFFDVDDVRLERDERAVRIPFRRWSYDEARRIGRGRWEAPWYRWLLTIENSRSLTLDDRAEIGSADFNTIRHERETRVVRIECSIPVTIRVEVDTLAVRLEETRELLGLARYRTAGDPRFATSYTGEVLRLPH